MKKQYPIERSPLFRLKTKSKLLQILNISDSDLTNTLACITYFEFEKKQKLKNRKIQDPFPPLKRLQKRLNSLFLRIKSPDYLKSKVGSSPLENARTHQKNPHILKLDIESFFPNVQREFVKKMFMFNFQMSDTVAQILTTLTTHKNFLPTGSPSSQVIAYYTFKITFDQIFCYCSKRNITFTLFVDDMVLSSINPIDCKAEKFIINRLNNVCLSINRNKIVRNTGTESKLITGVNVTKNGKLTARDESKKSVKAMISLLSKTKKIKNIIINNQLRNLSKSLLGTLQSIRNIEPHLYSSRIEETKKLVHYSRKYEEERILSLSKENLSNFQIANRLELSLGQVAHILNSH